MRSKAKCAVAAAVSLAVFFLAGCDDGARHDKAEPIHPPAGSAALSPEGYAEVVARLRPSLVTLEAQLPPVDDNLQQLFQQMVRGQRQSREESGSGLVVSAEGHIATTYRWAYSAGQILVRVNGLPPLEANVVGRDQLTGITLLKVDAQDLVPLSWPKAETLPEAGDLCLSMGNLGGTGLIPSLGLIGSAHWSADVSGVGAGRLILADTLSSPAHAGGGLFSPSGQLWGMLVPMSLFTSQSTAPLTFALPVEEVRYVVETLMATGKVPRGFLGIRTRNFHPQVDADAGHRGEGGALVSEVAVNSPAEESGLKVNDVIIAVDEFTIRGATELTRQIQRKRPGDQVVLELVRKGETLPLQVLLGHLPDQTR